MPQLLMGGAGLHAFGAHPFTAMPQPAAPAAQGGSNHVEAYQLQLLRVHVAQNNDGMYRLLVLVPLQ